jgi:hypothetical protein
VAVAVILRSILIFAELGTKVGLLAMPEPEKDTNTLPLVNAVDVWLSDSVVVIDTVTVDVVVAVGGAAAVSDFVNVLV